MRVLVCGSREVDDVNAAMRAIGTRYESLPETVIVHGGARGIDNLAKVCAFTYGFRVEEFLPDWEMYGRRAGIVRNLAMLDTKPDLVLAFWNGSSPGTAHTVREARRRGIPTEVIPI